MREVKRKGSKAKCPYCGEICRLEDEVTQCEHLYEIIAYPDDARDTVFYYFIKENSINALVRMSGMKD